MALTLTAAGLTIRHDESCSWMTTKQKTTSVSVADIVGCSVVEKASKSDEGRFCRLSILTKWTSSTSSTSSSASSTPTVRDTWVVYKPRRFVFEASVATALMWRSEIMKLVEEVKLSIVESWLRSKKAAGYLCYDIRKQIPRTLPTKFLAADNFH